MRMTAVGQHDVRGVLPKLLDKLNRRGDAGCLSSPEEVSQFLHSLTRGTIHEEFRQDLAWAGAVPQLLAFVRAFFNDGDVWENDTPPRVRDEAALRVMLLVTKLLRNLCAGVAANQESFRVWDGVGTMAIAAGRLLGVGSGHQGDALVPVSELLSLILQLLGNFANSDEQNQVAVWRTFFPELLIDLSQLDEARVYDPLCMLLFTCCRTSPGRSSELCGVGSPLLAALLRFAKTHLGYGRLDTESNSVLEIVGGPSDLRPAGLDTAKRDVHIWLELLLSHICLDQPLLAHAFISLGTTASGVLDADVPSEKLGSSNADSDTWKLRLETTAFSETQATLLGTLSSILYDRAKGNTGVNLRFPCDSATFLVDLIGVVAQGKHHQHGNSVSSDVLQFGLFIVSVLCATESENYAQGEHQEGQRHVIVMQFLSEGLPRLMVRMLEALGPPEATKVHCDTAFFRDEMEKSWVPMGITGGFVCVSPYPGYRRDVVGVLGNMTYENRHVQDAVRVCGGILVVLQQCVVDKDNPFLREWGFWAMRNILTGNEENQRVVEELELKGAVNTEDVHNMGFTVEVDTVTRRPKLVTRPTG